MGLLNRLFGKSKEANPKLKDAVNSFIESSAYLGLRRKVNEDDTEFFGITRFRVGAYLERKIKPIRNKRINLIEIHDFDPNSIGTTEEEKKIDLLFLKFCHLKYSLSDTMNGFLEGLDILTDFLSDSRKAEQARKVDHSNKKIKKKKLSLNEKEKENRRKLKKERKNRLQEVKQLTNQQELAHIFQGNENFKIRDIALNNITDLNVLRKIMKNDPDRFKREMASNRYQELNRKNRHLP